MWPNFSQQRGFSNVFISSARKRQNQDTIARTSNWNGNNRRKRPGVTKLKQENETTQLLRITSSATSEGQQCFSLTLMMEHEKTVLTTSCAFVLALLWQSCQQRTFLHSEIYSQSFFCPCHWELTRQFLLKERWSSTAAPKRLHNFVYTNPQRIRWVQMRSDSHSEYLT